MTRWWAVALLSLSVGLNLGLVVAVVQQRFAQPAPAPTVIVMPSPNTGNTAAEESPAPPVAVSEVGPPPVPVASPLRGPTTPSDRDDRPPARPAGGPGQAPPADELADALAGGQPPPPPQGDRGPGPLGPDRLDADGPGPAGRRGDGPPQERLEQMAARLGVPLEDRPRFIALQRTFIAETRQRHVQLEAARRALRAELLAPNPDPQRLRAYVDDSARLHAALERAFVEHVLAARELLDGEAERRYLQFLSRLGPRAGAPGPQPGRVRPGDPRWQRERPWDRRPGGGGRGGLRGPGGRGFDEPRPAPSPI